MVGGVSSVGIRALHDTHVAVVECVHACYAITNLHTLTVVLVGVVPIGAA